jgi:methionyl-tRNA formyltransferase
MRIAFLTDDNPLYVLPFFDEFLRNYAGEFEISAISSCRAMGKRKRTQLLKELLCLYGPIGMGQIVTRWAAARVLGALPRRPGARGYHTLKQLCQAYSIPYRRVGSPNQPGFIVDLSAHRPDLLVSIACPYILKEPLLATPKFGCINMHHAPLPRYKGMMPTFWQMFAGEPKVGITIHYMTPKIDEGEALFQGEMEILRGESLDSLIRRSKRHGAHCMAGVLRKIATQSQTVIALDKAAGSYFTFPTLEQIREFRRRGLRAI